MGDNTEEKNCCFFFHFAMNNSLRCNLRAIRKHPTIRATDDSFSGRD